MPLLSQKRKLQALSRTPCSRPTKAQKLHKDDTPGKPLPYLPMEIIGNIISNMPTMDTYHTARLVSKSWNHEAEFQLRKRLFPKDLCFPLVIKTFDVGMIQPSLHAYPAIATLDSASKDIITFSITITSGGIPRQRNLYDTHAAIIYAVLQNLLWKLQIKSTRLRPRVWKNALERIFCKRKYIPSIFRRCALGKGLPSPGATSVPEHTITLSFPTAQLLKMLCSEKQMPWWTIEALQHLTPSQNRIRHKQTYPHQTMLTHSLPIKIATSKIGIYHPAPGSYPPHPQTTTFVVELAALATKKAGPVAWDTCFLTDKDKSKGSYRPQIHTIVRREMQWKGFREVVVWGNLLVGVLPEEGKKF